MKMNKNILIMGVCLGLLILGAARFYHQSKNQKVPVVSSPNARSPSSASVSPSRPIPTPVPNRISITRFDDKNGRMKKHVWHGAWGPEEEAMVAERRLRLARDPFSPWKTVIEFYGLVVDENNVGLAGAEAKWTTTNTKGNGHGTSVSGTDGRFTINTQGSGINIDVEKTGYRTLENNRGFEFSEFYREDYYDGDNDHPTVFHLKKIPPYEPIYIWRNQLFKLNRLIGKQATFNPETGELDEGLSERGLSINLVAGPDNTPEHPQFSLVLMTSGGGVLKAVDRLELQAPVAGYKNPSDEKLVVDFLSTRPTETTVFFKDGVGNYGYLNLDARFVGLELRFLYRYKYNPNGGTSFSAPSDSEYRLR